MTVILGLLTRRVSKPSSAWWITLLVLLTLTLVFDNLIIIFGMVSYNPLLISGIHIGKAPIEDFFYAILACSIVPILWRQFAPKNEKKEL